MKRALAGSLACAAMAATGGSVMAGQPEALGALRQVFAAGSVRVDMRPGCEGPLLGKRQMTLGDLVASRLSVFQAGQNQVDGACDRAGKCQVTIDHMDGEDVSSFTLRFRSASGKLVPASITCESTP